MHICLVLAIHVHLLWKVQVKLRQKPCLAAFLCLSILMIIIAVIRISGFIYRHAFGGRLGLCGSKSAPAYLSPPSHSRHLDYSLLRTPVGARRIRGRSVHRVKSIQLLASEVQEDRIEQSGERVG